MHARAALKARTYAKAYKEVKSVGGPSAQAQPHHGEEQLRQLVVRELGDRLDPHRPRHHHQRRAEALARCPDVRARQHGPLRQLRRGLGFEGAPPDFWRPYAAIRAGDAEAGQSPHHHRRCLWKSYLETPPIQDYPSTHSALGAGAAEVLKRCLKTDRVPFSIDSLTALPENCVRSFNTFTQAANENANSRVKSRHPLPFATEQGKALGRTVGSYIVKHHLRPR